MKNLFTALCILLTLNAVMAQDRNFTVMGYVRDTAQQSVLPGASVYAENTSLGTITNADGFFSITLPQGGYNLIVSYTGYEKQVIRISHNLSMEDTLEVILQPMDNTLEAVDFVFTGEDPYGWEKYGAFFIKEFIGTTPNAANCHIENPEVLKFFYSAKRNRLKVTAAEDIIIHNLSLGYRIRYQLDSFRYDYKTLISQYTGYAFFEQIDSTEEAMIQWEKNRAATYLGSRLHFMRAFYHQQLAEEGFLVEKMIRKPGRAAQGELIPDIYADSLYVMEGDLKHIQWNGRYRIGYKKVWPHKDYLKEFKLDENLKVQVSLAETTKGFTIESNGYFYDQENFINSGYWAWKKIAELLPYDYEYE